MNCLFTVFILVILSSSYSLIEAEDVEDTEGLKIEITKKAETCPRMAKDDDKVSVHYTGYLTNGKEFDSSRKRNEPFVITLGHGMVIPGWEKGLQGMCVGEQRKLTIPPELAYGEQGIGDLIPGGSTLVFDVQMMDITDIPEEEKRAGQPSSEEINPDDISQLSQEELFAQIDVDGDKKIDVDEMAKHIKKHEGQQLGEDIDAYTMAGEIFQEDDKNKDGVITLDEFVYADPSPAHEEL
eukprot:gene16676-18368_t